MNMTQVKPFYKVAMKEHRCFFRWVFIDSVPCAVCDCGRKMTMKQVLDYVNGMQ
jgi:hypothetical protein